MSLDLLVQMCIRDRGHDITQIIKGVTKDAVFRKGHVITEEDIPVLLSVGKDNVYIWEKGETRLCLLYTSRCV